MNQNEFETNEEISLSEIYNIIKPNIITSILIGIVFALLAFLFTTVMIKPTYRSNGMMIINNRREDNNNVISTEEINTARNLAGVYNIIIKSDPVMTKVIEGVGADLKVSELVSKVTVASVDNTQVIRVSVTDTDPIMSQKYVHEIMNVAPDAIKALVDAGSVSVISYPETPTTPVSPNVKMNVLVAGMLGVMLTIGITLLRYFLNRTFTSPEQLESFLDVPVVGIIPNVNSVKRGK